MNTPPFAPAPPPLKDTYTGLIVFGILEIVAGAFCALLIPLSLLGQIAAAKKTAHDFNAAMALPTVVTFSALAIGLIWLGIGSAMARRWARALLLCFGWIGLCTGVIALAAVIPALSTLDQTLQQQGQTLQPGLLLVMKIVMVATVSILYIVIPGALVLFYRRPAVKLTCEARDPVERWTDRCPLPVVVTCILQVLTTAYIILLPQFGAAIPLAGTIVIGWPARLLWWGFAAFSILSARGFYRLAPRAWSIYTIGILAFWILSTATFLRIGLLEYYHAIGLPDWQVEQVSHSPLAQGHLFIYVSAISLVIYGGYLLYIRRYFHTPRTTLVQP